MELRARFPAYSLVLLAIVALPAQGQAPDERFEYAAKLICGIQKDPKDMRLARGFYATTINVHNPQRETQTFFKKLALTIPPGRQRPGKVIPIAEDRLEPDQALAVDCNELRDRLFNGTLPAPFIEGFVVIQSKSSLDVTGVYTTATLGRDGLAQNHSSVHVLQVRERAPSGRPLGKPDLVVQDVDMNTLTVSCPGGGGTCVTTVKVTIANIGTGDAGPFTTKTVLDPAQAVVVSTPFGSFPAGAPPMSFTVTTLPGGNCFDPDCTICVTVDDGTTVDESNEGNNQMCKTKRG